ncbi:YrdB family protein [Bacillus gobiensis]|uniref:YrdB family protein n=1 Tax=Bacillus gobiensis TaxID=1441095 RepID=UPI003D1F21FE
MIIIEYTVLAILFLLELSALAAFVYWGFQLDKGLAVKLIVGIGTPLLVAIFWGMFVSPKATIPVSVPIGILLKLVIFGAAAAALYFAGQKTLAIIFFIAVLVVIGLDYWLGF